MQTSRILMSGQDKLNITWTTAQVSSHCAGLLSARIVDRLKLCSHLTDRPSLIITRNTVSVHYKSPVVAPLGQTKLNNNNTEHSLVYIAALVCCAPLGQAKFNNNMEQRLVYVHCKFLSLA